MKRIEPGKRGTTKTLGELTHADFGKCVEFSSPRRGYVGILWSVDHCAAVGDIAEPWTRVILRTSWTDEGTAGLPPSTKVRVSTPLQPVDIDIRTEGRAPIRAIKMAATGGPDA